MKKRRPLWLKILLTLLLVGLAACVWEFASSKNPYLLPVKRAIKYDVFHISPVNASVEADGIGTGACTSFVNGEESGEEYVPGADNKHIWRGENGVNLVNYLDGYQMGFPVGTEFDFSLSPLFTRAFGDGWDATISREKATYAGMKDVISFELSTFFPFIHSRSVENYVDWYELRFLESDDWRANNRVRMDEMDCGREEGKYKYCCFQVEDPGELDYDTYFYGFVFTGSREYVRVMLRWDSKQALGQEILPWFQRAVEQMRTFDPTGEGVYQTNYAPVLPENWSDETAALYESIAESDTLRWGIFTQDIFESGTDTVIPALEEQLGYRFDVELCYIHFDMDFPTDFLQKNWDEGRLVELTWQLTENNNEDMFARSPLLDICRGERDDDLRAFARSAAAFGGSFLLRLNNEMNSDWTSYSGVVNLADPQLYVTAWQRIYRIFEEEGVNNCIWIFNPHDRSAPPEKWNDGLAFYPGNEYVQMLGVTGYNNGTYYTQNNEQWRSFTTIYDEIDALYRPHFAAFPWIITEFASSSIGGDKVAWINEMFAHIHDYPNLKIAVWFSSADYDGETPARPYWLDETEQTLAAFRDGLAASGA